MKEGFLLFLNFFLICFESIMAAYLGRCFFQKRYGSAVYVLAVCVLTGLSNLFFFFFGSIPIVKFIFGICLHAVWISIVFQVNIIKSVFTSLLLLSYWIIVDSLFIMCISSFGGNDTNLIFASPYAYYLMCFGGKALELLGIVILSAFAKKHFQIWTMSWMEWLRILFFPLSTLLISIELTHMFFMAPNLAKELSLCAGILLLADVMSVFLLDHMEKQQLAIRDRAILQQDLKTERESISAWVTAYREERKRSHDFQNQLSVLRGMVAERVSDETFLQYIDSLLNVKLPATRYINTNRPVADVLLSQKAAIAKSKHISFQMHLDDLSDFPLPDDELVVVLANLLDNAIEACELISDARQRYILIKIQCKPDVTYLHIENPTAEPVTIKGNRVITSRKDSASHGFGLQNVATILRMHQALYTLTYQEADSVFCFSAQILTDP